MLKVTICYEQRKEHYCWQQYPQYILMSNINKHCTEIFFSRDNIEINYHLLTSNNREISMIRSVFCRRVFSDALHIDNKTANLLIHNVIVNYTVEFLIDLTNA